MAQLMLFSHCEFSCNLSYISIVPAKSFVSIVGGTERSSETGEGLAAQGNG